MNNIFTKRNTIIFIGILTLWRIYLATSLQLHPDEAYYWLWSRFLDISYFDHPPMVAYFIRISTILGISEIFVRLSSILVSILVSIIAFKCMMHLFNNEKAALLSVIFLNIYPITMTGSIIITPDVPAFLFWSLCVYYTIKIFKSGLSKYWIILGITFGCALLSKYTTILFAPCLFLFLLLTEERHWLKTIYPYLALLISGLIFLPVVYWNSINNWMSFRFQIHHGFDGKGMPLFNLLEFIGSQVLVISPLIWIFGIIIILSYFIKPKERFFILCTSIPVILFFAYSSLKNPGEANWPALAYFTFSFAIGLFFGMKDNLFNNIILWILIVSALIMSFLVTLHARFTLLPLKRFNQEWVKTDATNWFYGWKELGTNLNNLPEGSLILTPSHQLSAEIAYYTNNKFLVYTDTDVARISQFNIWQSNLHKKNNMIAYVYSENGRVGDYNKYFLNIDEVSTVRIFRKGEVIREYRIIKGKNL